jgi:hypothetical protein
MVPAQDYPTLCSRNRKFYKGRSQEKNRSLGRNFSFFAAHLIEQDLFLTCRTMCSVAGLRGPAVWVFSAVLDAFGNTWYIATRVTTHVRELRSLRTAKMSARGRQRWMFQIRGGVANATAWVPRQNGTQLHYI